MRPSQFVITSLIFFLFSWACSEEAVPTSNGTEVGNVGNQQEPTDLITNKPGEEVELEENFRSPVISGPFLWSANPETNRVARIDARSFSVTVLDAGHGPTFLAALPGAGTKGGALVLNVLGGDASMFRPSSTSAMGGAAGTELVETRFAVQTGASAWAVGKGGRFAIAWSRFEEDLKGPLDGYQDLTIVALDGDEPNTKKLSVGYRPSDVLINEEESRAYVVSEPGISVIDLTREPPSIVREIFLPDEETGTRDVSLTPDGRYAFVRLPRSSEILVIDTEDDLEVRIQLPREVTDLDLSGDGSLAVAVMRGSLPSGVHPPAEGGAGGLGGGDGAGSEFEGEASQIALMKVPDIFFEPTSFTINVTEELVGSVVLSDDGSAAGLYTNAIANSRLSVLRIDSGRMWVTDLQAPAQAVFLSQNGLYATAVMTPPSGSGRSGAFALVPLSDSLPLRIEGTTTVPRFISMVGDRALVTTWGSETSPAEVFLGKFPDLSVDRMELLSEPLASGIVAEAGQGFVAQQHAEGRVTFLDLESSLPTTVTGFELASKVVQQ